MRDLTNEQRLALEHAAHLVENGVPLFLARGDDGNPCGYRLPKNWQNTEPDTGVVDRWRPGMALCAVMGHLVDAIDIDPRNEGDVSLLNGTMPTTYGQQATPSGGTHFLVATLGVRNGKPFRGVDLQAGDAAGKGRGFIFLAPTERRSKVSGELVAYRWVEDPELEALALIGCDESGASLAALLSGREGPLKAHFDPGLPATLQELSKAENVLLKSADPSSCPLHAADAAWDRLHQLMGESSISKGHTRRR